MNKIFKLSLIFIASAMSLQSCSDFLDEKTNGQVFDNALETQVGLEAALTGTYKQWTRPWDCGFLHTWPLEITMGGEDLTSHAGAINCMEIDTYCVTNTNSSIPAIYKSCYSSIRNANSVIEAAETCQGDENVIKQIAGEAHFIRAYDYFWLARMHKAIPMMLSSKYNPEDANKEMTPTAQIYEQVEIDLLAAIDLLPEKRRNNDMGRPNKGTAQAVLAEVYLMEAGYPLNKPGYYEKAAEMAKKVIANKTVYGFDFEESYKTLFYRTQDNGGGINKESVLVIPANNSNWMYGTPSGPSEIGGWGYLFAQVDFYEQFPEGVRKDYTFMTDYEGKTYEQLSVAHPFYQKMSYEGQFRRGGTSVAVNLLRFSQTALTYAEAKARTSGPDQLAYNCLNTIRKRAGLSTYTGLSNEEFADKCVEERKWEFAAEGVRWWDIVRLDLLDEVIANRGPKELSIVGPKGKENYFFPIPNFDEVLNPNINK